jgi:hypothetical protein
MPQKSCQGCGYRFKETSHLTERLCALRSQSIYNRSPTSSEADVGTTANEEGNVSVAGGRKTNQLARARRDSMAADRVGRVASWHNLPQYDLGATMKNSIFGGRVVNDVHDLPGAIGGDCRVELIPRSCSNRSWLSRKSRGPVAIGCLHYYVYIGTETVRGKADAARPHCAAIPDHIGLYPICITSVGMHGEGPQSAALFGHARCRSNRRDG